MAVENLISRPALDHRRPRQGLEHSSCLSMRGLLSDFRIGKRLGATVSLLIALSAMEGRSGSVAAQPLPSGSVAAQPLPPPADRGLELFFGIGSLGSYAATGALRAFPWLHAGAAMWLSDSLGVALRYTHGVGSAFSDEVAFGLKPHRYLYSGTRKSRFSTVTTRYRVILDNRLSLTMGIGAQLTGSTKTRLLRREIWVPITSLSDADRSSLRPLGEIDERIRRPWGQGLALEMLVGRRFSQRMGVTGGVLLQGDWRKDVKYQVVVLADFRP